MKSYHDVDDSIEMGDSFFWKDFQDFVDDQARALPVL